MTVGFHADAEDEFIGAATYYELQVDGLGSRLISEVSRTLDLISANPQLGSPSFSNTRRLRVARFPYSIVYLVDVVGIDRLAGRRLRHRRLRRGCCALK